MSSISEGFPKALIEAMACGLSCISTDVGSCKLIINGAGITVEKENVEQLFKAMVELKKIKISERVLKKSNQIVKAVFMEF